MVHLVASRFTAHLLLHTGDGIMPAIGSASHLAGDLWIALQGLRADGYRRSAA